MKLLPIKIILLTLLFALAPALAGATDASDLPDGTDIKGAADHPQIQRFAGSSIRYYEKKAFDEMQVALGPVNDDKPKIDTVEGVHTLLVYVMPQDVSTLEAVRAYQAELSKIGEVKLLFSGVNGGGRNELEPGFNKFVARIYGDVSGASRWMSWLLLCSPVAARATAAACRPSAGAHSIAQVSCARPRKSRAQGDAGGVAKVRQTDVEPRRHLRRYSPQIRLRLGLDRDRPAIGRRHATLRIDQCPARLPQRPLGVRRGPARMVRM